MAPNTILVARPLPEPLMQALEGFGEVRVLDADHGNTAGAHIFVATAIDPVPASLIERFPDSLGLIANIGTGTETRIVDVITHLARLYGKSVEVEHIDRRDIDNIRRRVLNIERIRTRLRWQPQFSLEEGLKRTYQWFHDRKK